MKNYSPDRILNIALLGHGSSGKTTFAEAALYLCGDAERMGKAVDGSFAMYSDAEERKRCVSVAASVAALERGGYKLNIIDAPGLFDFAAGTREAVRAADSALIVLSGKSGLNVGSEQAYDLCAAKGKPCAFFIGKLDSAHAAYNKVLSGLTGRFGAAVCPVVAPFYEGEKLAGYVDLIGKKAYTYAAGKPSECAYPDGDERIANLYDLMIEAVASQDEALMEKYFEGEALSTDEIISGLKAGVAAGEIMPVFAGAQQICEGVDLALDIMTKIMPAADTVTDSGVKCDPNGPAAAIVFKTVADPFVGKISVFKVVSGRISPSTRIINARTGEEQRISKPLVLKGSKQLDTDCIPAGDIGAVTKLGGVKTGDTLCEASNKVELEGVEYPKPTISMAVRAVRKGDEEKIAAGLARLMEEDPTVTYVLNTETGEQVLSGLGESHLDVIASKLKSKFAADMQLSVPKVAYREAIRKKVKVQGRHKKQSGGHGQFGDVWIEFEPYDGTDMLFEEKVFGGSVPKNFFPAVEKGLRDCVAHGVLAGYPVVGLKATLVDGSYHPVDSSEMAFKTAAALAYKAGLPEANPVLLEPVGTLTVTLPDDCVGEVIGDINKRRGRVLGMNPAGNKLSEIVAEVPVGEMQDFSTAMRSITQGRASFTLEFARYEEMPPQLAKKIIDEADKAE